MRAVLTVAAIGLLLTTALSAGNAHFVGAPSIKISGDTVTVSGKVAGLGDVPQIHVTISGLAECVNRGGNKPSAENKQAFSAEGSFPVQNGRAYFSLSLTAILQPSCNPPMTIAWSDLSVLVTAEDGTVLTYQ